MAFANLSSLAAWSYIDGRWVEGNPPIMGPMSQGYQFASMVFDGARSLAASQRLGAAVSGANPCSLTSL